MTMIELDNNDLITDNKPKQLEIFKNKIGKKINTDYFLYSCFEQEKARKALENPDCPYSSQTMKSISAENLPTFEVGVDQIITHYKHEFDALANIELLDVAALPHFIPVFVNLLHEVFAFAKIVHNFEDLPLRDDHIELNRTFWNFIDQKFMNSFPGISEMIKVYFQWRYQSTEPKKLDLSSVPPIGIYTKLHLKARDKAEYEKRNQQREDSRPAKKIEHSNHEHKRSHQKDKDKKLGKPQKDQNDNRNSERTNEVIAEAKEAITKIKNDSSIVEITLKPQNSFLRRIQHQFIGEQGFKSESTGEGKDRAIKIIRG